MPHEDAPERFDVSFFRLRASIVDSLAWVSSFELPPNLMHLLSRSVQGAGVVNHIIGGFYFFFVGELRGHAASDFPGGGFETEVLSGGKTFYALLVAAGDHDQAIETLGNAGFDDQRGFHDSYGAGIEAPDLAHPFFLSANHRGMQDPVQLVDLRRFLLRDWLEIECRVRQPGAVDGA